MVVITGATGHLGGVLVRELLGTGERVRVVTRPGSDTTGIDGLPVEVYDCGLFDEAALKRVFAGATVVYHAAARISFGGHDAQALHRINVDGTRSVLEAARTAAVGRFVYVGSIETFPLPAHDFPVTEDQAIDPSQTVMEYGRSKALATDLVLDATRNGLDAVIACPTSFLGPPDFRLSPMGRMIYDFAGGKLPAYVTGGFDFVDVRDVAHGVVLAARKGRSGECYLLSGHYISIPDFMDLLERISGVRKPLFCFPTRVLLPVIPLVEIYYRMVGRPPRFTRDSISILSHNVTVDSGKAQRELGYASRPLVDTVRDLLDWFQQAGMLPETTQFAEVSERSPEEAAVDATTETE